MKNIFDSVSLKTSELVTKTYSTSFSIGIKCLHKMHHKAIYSIYGFVRFADEIVDSFHNYNKETLLKEFTEETYKAIERKISLNPILNSFAQVVNKYNIEHTLIDTFLRSMEMDLKKETYTPEKYNEYILGSAEVVGLMCLKVFTNNNTEFYEVLKPNAMSLGAAFQKVNFLRDIKQDYNELGRTYFPNIDIEKFSEADKKNIEQEIENDFKNALLGIKLLPQEARLGVYVAFIYYKSLFNKIKHQPYNTILQNRVRISNSQKIVLLFKSYMKHSFNSI